MYTVMISDDGMFSAEYVVPAALSVPLGSSGSAVDVVRNEDGTYSANGEVITAETMVTAANGNVYRAILSPEGIPVGVDHVAAMQDVMLGDHGGSVTLTQAEDKSWWYGEAAVASGYVHTAANGNMCALTLDAEGMWSAMYQQVEVMAALGTQGSITVVRAEDMSWWLGSEAVDVASEVMSDSGNTYTLWYTDGVWSARFEPVPVEIKGTGGVMVFSREADDMRDVESAGSGMTLAADGAGQITTSAGAKYRVSMVDGMLSGVRFDAASKGDTVYITVGLDSALAPDAEVSYIADDRDTAFNEANTKVTVAGETISLGDLLDDGMAAKPAAASDGAAGEFVKSAVDALMDLRTEAELYAKYQAAATNDAGRGGFDERLNSIAERAQEAVDMIFGTNATTGEAVISEVNIIDDGTLPIEDTEDATDGFQLSATDYIRATQTVRGLNRLLDALSSAEAFVAATKGGNNGVFEAALGEDAARNAFSANKSEYMVYFGTTENTRYGAIALKERASAEFTPTAGEAMKDEAAVHDTRFEYDGATTDNDADNVEFGRVGAFSYATVNDTLRARNLPQTGGAVYEGGTVAATPAGTLYSGDMQIDVNFRQQSVFGRVSDLRDKDNNLRKYLDSDVDTIYLPRQNYNNQAQFGGSGANGDLRRGGTGEFKTATVVYSQSQGFSTTPTEQPKDARFAGRFIGSDGAEITGTWSLGQPVEGQADDTATSAAENVKRNDLDVIFGSYGVTRQDSSGPAGPADGTAGGRAKTTVTLPGTDTEADPATLGAMFAGDADTAGILRLGKASTGGDQDADNDFLLTRIFAQPGADPKQTTNNGPTHVSVVVDHIMAQRDIYVIYAEQVGGDSDQLDDLANVGRQTAWKSINDFVRDHIFNLDPIAPAAADDDLAVSDVSDVQNLSSPLGSYFYPMTRNSRPDDDAALEQIDTLLAAFADSFALEAALDDDAGGIFDSQPALDIQDPDTGVDPFPLNDNLAQADEPIADIFGRRASQTHLFSLSTDYTRFGVWYRRQTESAVHDWANHVSPDDGAETDPANTGSDSPGSYAYNWLNQSAYRTDRAVATYPSNGLATYGGKTLAMLRDNRTYVGDALIRVNWRPLDTTTTPGTPIPQSTIVPIFSNFVRWDDGSLDRLVHDTAGDNATLKIVDEIVFRTSGGSDLVMTDDDAGNLMIEVTNAAATITYTDGTRIGTAVADSTFMAKFVGSSGDGPLGILGTWEVPSYDLGTAPADVRDMVGSFGADLTGFETLLP